MNKKTKNGTVYNTKSSEQAKKLAKAVAQLCLWRQYYWQGKQIT